MAKYEPEMCQKALEVLKNGESLAAVSCELGVTRQTIYDWQKLHPEFNDAIELGLAACQRHWEQIGKDGIVGNYEKFGGTPWLFTMKNRFRKDYQDKDDSKSDDTKSVLEKIISGELKVKHD